MLLCFLALVPFACDAQPVSDIALMLDGEPFSSEELDSGRYALAFLVVEGCPACMSSLQWLPHAADAFPEIRFLLVSPVPSAELQGEDLGCTGVLIDSEGKLGGAFRIERVPEVSFLVEGVLVKQLDWPFTEGELLRACAESLLIDIQRPDPSTLVGEMAPAIEAVGLDGMEVNVTDLHKPHLLVFFRMGCSTCWETLMPLNELADVLPVVLIAMASSEEGITDSDRQRLAQFEQVTMAGRVSVVLTYGARIPQDYGLSMSPTFCLVDAEGLVAEVWEGQLDRALLSERVHVVGEEGG